MTDLIPAHYDTRESFRARFAAAYEDHDAMESLCWELYTELNDEDIHDGAIWYRADLAHLRELALNLEHTLYALAELQQAYRCAAGSVKAGVA